VRKKVDNRLVGYDGLLSELFHNANVLPLQWTQFTKTANRAQLGL